MFTKNKEPETISEQPPAPKRSQQQRPSAPSLISSDLTVIGSLISTGDLQVDGRVEGDVRATALVIGESATVQGDIYAEDAIIRGRIEGAIKAHKVQLCASSHVEGNILHKALTVEAGAFFEGNCRHSDNPLADAIDAQTGARRIATPGQTASSAPGKQPGNAASAGSTSGSKPAREDTNSGDRAAASFAPLKA